MCRKKYSKYVKMSETETENETMNKISDIANQSLEKITNFTANRSITFWIVLSAVIVILIILSVYIYISLRRNFVKYVDCADCYLRFDNFVANPIGKQPTSYTHLGEAEEYSYSMWLYIADWYHQYNKWKNVFYKGSAISSACSNISWDMIPDQNPGIWLSDIQNNLRIVIKTSISIPSACLNNAGLAGLTTTTDTQQDGGSSVSFSNKLSKCLNKPHLDKTSISILEYAEIKNIPIGKWFQIIIVLRKQRLELYLNGKLHITKMLMGMPVPNNSDGYFSAVNPYLGRISNFRYMPHYIPYQIVKMIYDKETNMSFKYEKDPMNEIEN